MVLTTILCGVYAGFAHSHSYLHVDHHHGGGYSGGYWGDGGGYWGDGGGYWGAGGDDGAYHGYHDTHVST